MVSQRTIQSTPVLVSFLEMRVWLMVSGSLRDRHIYFSQLLPGSLLTSCGQSGKLSLEHFQASALVPCLCE